MHERRSRSNALRQSQHERVASRCPHLKSYVHQTLCAEICGELQASRRKCCSGAQANSKITHGLVNIPFPFQLSRSALLPWLFAQ